MEIPATLNTWGVAIVVGTLAAVVVYVITWLRGQMKEARRDRAKDAEVLTAVRKSLEAEIRANGEVLRLQSERDRAQIEKLEKKLGGSHAV